MRLDEFIAKAKNILGRSLNEHSGSEGLAYILETTKPLAIVDNHILAIEKRDDNKYTVNFKYPHDCGFALNTIKAVFGDIEIVSLQLLY